jgi:2-polyprenyl-3-methyl-5-hydroxy-6-metoxy-1,4-benzoquinol methylase
MNCLLCQGTGFTPHFSFVRGDSTGKLEVVKCDSCSHIQMSSEVYNIEHYQNDQQVCASIKECGTSFEKFIEHSWIEAQRRVDRIHTDHLISSNHLKCLDIGGGYGFFAHLLSQINDKYITHVLEPSEQRISKGKELIHHKYAGQVQPEFLVSVLDDTWSKHNTETYDLVTIWHVLEHVPDPISMVRHAWQLLKPGGWLSIEVPNEHNDLLTRSSAFARYHYMIEHISYFSPKTLSDTIFCAIGKEPDKLYGYQRYGLFNDIHWMHANAPLGDDPDFFPGMDRWWLEKIWREHREESLITDALVVNVRKPL